MIAGLPIPAIAEDSVLISDLATIESLARQGNAIAQYNLGVMYAAGSDVEQDNVKAFEWLNKSASQGLAEAQYNIGVMYDQGIAVP